MEKKQSLLQSIIEGIQERKGNNLISMSFSNIENSVAKHFVIADAASSTHLRALAESVEEFTMKHNQVKAWSKEGIANSEWIILDYGDIVVHIFQSEIRQKYSLEELWADSEIIEYN